MAVIAAYRVVGSLPVLRWPLAGSILAMLVDLCDLFLMDWLGGISNYQSFDKYCDLVYMITFLVVALRWEAVPRTIAVSLFAYRMVGFTVFEITSSRDVLLIFPNVFEFWFVFVAAIKHFKVDFDYTPAQLIVWGSALTVTCPPKTVPLRIAVLRVEEGGLNATESLHGRADRRGA